MNSITIKEPFYGAGTTMGWPDKYGLEGVGLHTYLLLNGADELEIKIADGREFIVDRHKLKEFVKKHDSFKDAKGTRLAIVPTSLLEELNTKVYK